jgi:hypothetical protein
MGTDVPVELYDEDSSVDDLNNEDDVMEVEGSLPKKALPIAHTPPIRLETRQDFVEEMDREAQSSTSRAEIDAASGLYKQMCNLRQQVS